MVMNRQQFEDLVLEHSKPYGHAFIFTDDREETSIARLEIFGAVASIHYEFKTRKTKCYFESVTDNFDVCFDWMTTLYKKCKVA